MRRIISWWRNRVRNTPTCNSWVTPENYRELSVVIKRSDLAQMSSESLGIDDLILTPFRSRYCRLFAS
ncbi:hypothetical protein D3C80_1807190 [compost metagenome]